MTKVHGRVRCQCSGELGEGYIKTLYHLCNFSVDLKLFQNKMLIFKKVAGFLVPGLTLLRKRNGEGRQEGEQAGPRMRCARICTLAGPAPWRNGARVRKSLPGAQEGGQARALRLGSFPGFLALPQRFPESDRYAGTSEDTAKSLH